MSHVRNLFYRPSGQIQGAQPTAAAAAAATAPGPVVAPAPSPVPEKSVAVTALPAFPAVEARIRAENRLVYQTDPRSSEADRFRLLRMHLREHWNAGKLKKLLITSPLAHDGKSTIVVNLATALAERGKRAVLVVEADLHHANLAENLGLNPVAGLAECLQDDSTAPLSTIRLVEPLGWHLMQAGEPRRNPTELLQTPAFGNIIQRLSAYFDWILIDSPPTIPLTDSLSLQQHADGTLVIVRAGKTPRDTVEETVKLLGRKKIVGMVLNGVDRGNHLYSQYRYERDSK